MLGNFFYFERDFFDNFLSKKGRFWDFFKVVLELFRECSGIVFLLKTPTVASIFSPKGRKLSLKLKFRSNCVFWERDFLDHFCGQKSHFLNFYKVVLELIRKFLVIVFGLTRPLVRCSLQIYLKIEHSGKMLVYR